MDVDFVQVVYAIYEDTAVNMYYLVIFFFEKKFQYKKMVKKKNHST